MLLDPKTKMRIDHMTYEELLRKWRFAPAGDMMFQGESGTYYSKRMAELRDRESNPAAVSKTVGWK